jgi:hypothetical protein
MERFAEIIDRKVQIRTIKADLEKWFDDVYIKNASQPREIMKDDVMVPGKIYTFKYFTDPKERFYDLHPTFLMLYAKTVNNDSQVYGINLSVVPPLQKIKILGKLYDFYYNKGIAVSADNINSGRGALNLTPFDYKFVSTLIQNTGYQLAMAVYKRRKIIGHPMIVTYDEWWKVCLLTPKYIKKINSSALYKLYDMEKNNSKALSEAEARINGDNK